MDDLIRRQAVLDAINNFDVLDGYEDKQELIRQIEQLPSAEKKGHWIHHDEYEDDYWECSECLEQYVLEFESTPEGARMYFCPECGTRMV